METLSFEEQQKVDRQALERIIKASAPQDEVAKVLTHVDENNGQTGLPIIFWRRLEITPVLEQWSFSEDAHTALVAFNEGLKARGIHLIVAPVPTSVTTHLHRLSDQIQPDRDLMPGYTEGLIKLIDDGVEVLDLRQAFAEASDPQSNPLMNRADFHWATGGVALAAELLAPRLQRLEGIQALESRPQDWEQVPKSSSSPICHSTEEMISGQTGLAARELFKTKEEAFRANNIPLEEEAIWYTYTGNDRLIGYRTWGPGKGESLDHPFIVIGDSQARENTNRSRKAQHGGGLANQLSARLGILGTTFSMNGDVDRVPSVFVESEILN